MILNFKIQKILTILGCKVMKFSYFNPVAGRYAYLALRDGSRKIKWGGAYGEK